MQLRYSGYFSWELGNIAESQLTKLMAERSLSWMSHVWTKYPGYAVRSITKYWRPA